MLEIFIVETSVHCVRNRNKSEVRHVDYAVYRIKHAGDDNGSLQPTGCKL